MNTYDPYVVSQRRAVRNNNFNLEGDTERWHRERGLGRTVLLEIYLFGNLIFLVLFHPYDLKTLNTRKTSVS